jgi:hypothetical protein
MKAMSIDPADRYANAAEFRAALVEWLESQNAPLSIPEYRRATRTPGLPAARSGNMKAAAKVGAVPWQEETLVQSSSDAGAGAVAMETPIVSSSPQVPPQPPRSRRRQAVAAAASALLVGGLVLALARGNKHPAATGSAAPDAPHAPPQMTALASANTAPTPPPVTATPEPPPPPAAAAAPPAPSAAVAVDTRAPQSAARGPLVKPSIARSGKSASAPTVPVAVATSDPAKPADPPAAKPTEKLEGREIRNSL